MKKTIVLIFSVLLLAGSVMAQSLLNSREPEIRHSTGMKFIGYGYYFDKYGFSLEGNFSYNLKNTKIIKGSFSFWKGKIKLSDYIDYHIDLSWAYTFFHLKAVFSQI
jgi:hypothetical protein